MRDRRLDTAIDVKHYHFTGWEDWQLPKGSSRTELATLVEQAADWVTANSEKAPAEKQRLLVHCRAGIGRTGTTLALIQSTIAIKEQ